MKKKKNSNVGKIVLLVISIIVITILLIRQFTGSSPSVEFRDKIIVFAEDDVITDKECKELNKIFAEIKKTRKDIVFNEYLTSTLNRVKDKIDRSSLDVSKCIQDTTDNLTFNMHFYIEGSGSMDPYIKGTTQFENDIYLLLAKLNGKEMIDSINLNYITTQSVNIKTNALKNDIEKFIRDVEPKDVIAKVGDTRGTTTFSKMLDTILNEVNEKNAAVMVSDFVFSPCLWKERKNESCSTLDELISEKTSIYSNFLAKIKETDLAVVGIQLESNFTGTYYYEHGNSYSAQLPEIKRPYYLWFFGTRAQITKLREDDINKIDAKNIHFFEEPVKTKLDYRIIAKPVFGKFDNKGISKGKIIGAEMASTKEKKFGFKVAVNLSNVLQDDAYLTDIKNYEKNPNYSLKIDKFSTDDAANYLGKTHFFTFTTDVLKKENLRVKLKAKLPNWLDDAHCDDDSDIKTNPITQRTTYGIKYLFEGIYNGFYEENDNIAEFNIQIEK